jgi:hypothetical protein
MNRLRAACLFLKGGSSAVRSVVSRWEFVSLLLLPKLQSYLHADSSSTSVHVHVPIQLRVENGRICCMIGKSKEARKYSRHARRVTAQHNTAQQSTTYQHTRQTWMAVE